MRDPSRQSDQTEPAVQPALEREAKRARRIAQLAAAVALLGAAGGYVARRAAADGVPTMQPLQIAGYLEESGRAAEGARTFAARIFASETDTTALCNTGNVPVEARAGHFRFALTNDCIDAVRRTPDAWLEVTAVGSVGAFPRVKMGAAPYALEADRVVEVYGPLRMRLDAATARRAQRPAECPVGYRRNTTGVPPSVVLCAHTTNRDEVVRVGSGPVAFWIDRYEASLWLTPNGEGTQVGYMGRPVPDTFGRNGSYTTPLYAVSRPNAEPSRSLTWAQAAVACRISGKRLPTNAEWQAAASGTPDGGAGCRLIATPRMTGMGSACRSRWGAEDMVGNVAEWVSEWRAGVGDGGAMVTGAWPDPVARMQSALNVSSRAVIDANATTPTTATVPAALLRGGHGGLMGGAGPLAVQAEQSPAAYSESMGFRCVIAR